MVAPLLAPIVTMLAQNGLSLLAGAVQAKGKQAIEEKLGVTIPDDASQITGDKLVELKKAEMQHEEFLVSAHKELVGLELKAEEIATQEVTKRWQADMLSDSWLSKNIRPLILAYTMVVVTLFAVAAIAGHPLPDVYLALFKELLSIMVGAYFIGRSVEKGIDVYQGWKQTRGN